MNETFKGFFGFWRGVFSESDGTPSFSRLFTGIAVIASLFWVRHIVYLKHEIPDMVPVVMLWATLYGINKGSDVITAFKSK